MILKKFKCINSNGTPCACTHARTHARSHARTHVRML